MMVRKVLAFPSKGFPKSRYVDILACKPFTSMPFSSNHSPFHTISSLGGVSCKALGQNPAFRACYVLGSSPVEWRCGIHFSSFLNAADKAMGSAMQSEKGSAANGAGEAKAKRKKLKGKRAVVRWLKRFRYKKKKEYERMTPEEKIMYKLKKARKKEERYVEALKKLEPKESSEMTHDPEILTPEEHFFFLKMGIKCKNYVPVGRRGIYQGVILNMHLHWKKHQTLQVVVKTFTPDEVKEIAGELARLTGGIVLDIVEENKIIMYRGKNYCQPPTEIMSPRETLGRKKALDKSKYRDALRAVRKYIPRLEQDLTLLQAQAKSNPDFQSDAVEEIQTPETDGVDLRINSTTQLDKSDKLKELFESQQHLGDVSLTDSDITSDSEDLSGLFETDTETDIEKAKRPLYLDTFEKFPIKRDEESVDFEEHLRQISADSKREKLLDTDEDSPDFDEVDRVFLRAASLLKKKRR